MIPRRVPAKSEKSISQFLLAYGFTQLRKDRLNPATESYSKAIADTEIEVEFLTDDYTRRDKARNVEISGVIAQPLSYLRLSLEMKIPFKTFSGLVGHVVSPGAWIFHKGLTFTRRTQLIKSFKDLYGIWYVSTQLGVFSDATLTELNTLSSFSIDFVPIFEGKEESSYLPISHPTLCPSVLLPKISASLLLLLVGRFLLLFFEFLKCYLKGMR